MERNKYAAYKTLANQIVEMRNQGQRLGYKLYPPLIAVCYMMLSH